MESRSLYFFNLSTNLESHARFTEHACNVNSYLSELSTHTQKSHTSEKPEPNKSQLSMGNDNITANPVAAIYKPAKSRKQSSDVRGQATDCTFTFHGAPTVTETKDKKNKSHGKVTKTDALFFTFHDDNHVKSSKKVNKNCPITTKAPPITDVAE